MNEGEKSYLHFTLQAAVAELQGDDMDSAVERLIKYIDYYKSEIEHD